MDKELEDKIFNDFPEFFKNRGNMQMSLMGFGFECGNGWYQLIYKLCADIKEYYLTQYEGVGYEGETYYHEVPAHFSIEQVKEKFGCYDKKTEILTEEGWKYFKDIKLEDKIATLKNGIELEYQKSTDIIKYKYKGKMYHLKTRGVDITVTPNHNLYVSKGDYWNGRYKPPKKREYQFELITPDKYFNINKKFLKSAKWSGEKIYHYTIKGYIRNNDYIDKIGRKVKRKYIIKDLKFDIIPFLKFLGWYVAEGYYKKSGISLCLNKNNENELKEVKSILNNLHLKYKLEEKSGIIRIYNKLLGDWLDINCGHLAPNKKVPSFIKTLQPNLIKLFLKCLYSGDGHKSVTSNILTTVSKQLANDVQELILKLDNCATIYTPRMRKDSIFKNRIIIPNYKTFEINWMTHSKYHNTQNKVLAKNSIEEWVDYDDMVYCVTVPNKIIYVRRNGLSYFCGNSLRFYISPAPKFVHELIREAELKSYTICEHCGKELQWGIQSDGVYKSFYRDKLPWILTLCDECLRAHLAERHLPFKPYISDWQYKVCAPYQIFKGGE
jgi:hypothetical protein